MRILLISSAFSGLTQRYFTELSDAGFDVSVEIHTGDMPLLMEGVELFQPDLILCPFLKHKVPKEIYENYRCLIVHPGIKGDRGPSSLDWAIQEEATEWGVTLMAAEEEMDAGPIWASKTFPMRPTTKSSLFSREVTQAAVDCLWEVLTYCDAPDFKPEPLDYSKSTVKGRLRPLMKQADRTINWKQHTAQEILARINAADGSPGVLDQIEGKTYYLYNAHLEKQLKGKAGDIIAMTDQAICRATIDGAIWIGHLREQTAAGKGIKLPAAYVLQALINNQKPSLLSFLSKPIKEVTIDYSKPGKQLPCQEVWFELEDGIAYLHFAFHNGGMSTQQCRLLLSVYQHIQTWPVKVIVLMGGDDFWSNGIHLNHIEAAEDAAEESWLNINAIDDLIYQILTTLDKLTISAVSGNAGAGGAILAIASDLVFAREGVVFNPHYKNMGELYGSEYWTYLLPKRVGQELAMSLTEQRLPISAKKAWRMGLINKMLDKQHKIFHAQVRHLARGYCLDSEELKITLQQKASTRCLDESIKPLATYRQFELTQMYANFYSSTAYHEARKNFVYKLSSDQKTPHNIAFHRQTVHNVRVNPGSMYHFVWEDMYQMGDDLVDSQHKDLFDLANHLVSAKDQKSKIEKLNLLYQHVKEHFDAEEAIMTKIPFRGYQSHQQEHKAMLDLLIELNSKISIQQNQEAELQEFMEKWVSHIINFDMRFNRYLQEHPPIEVESVQS